MKEKKIFKSSKHLITLIFWISLVTGIILRFSYLDSKVFWHDEIYTELRVSGYKKIDPFNARQNKITGKQELLEFQGFSKNKNVGDILSSLKEDVHVPLYYVLLRYWQAILGKSIAITRAFSAFWGCLSLLGIYLLVRKLFVSEETAMITTSLVALSPTFIRYSQDARPYSLWFCCGVFSTYLLLSVLKHNTLEKWLLYGLSVVATSYTQLLSFYLYIGHGLYVLITQFKNPKVFVKYIVVSLFSVLLFLPWVITSILPKIDSMTKQTAWLKIPMPPEKLFQEHIKNLNHLFISLDFSDKSNLVIYSLGFLLAALVAYSFYILISKKGINKFFLPLSLSLSSYIFLYQDLFIGGQRTRINQYFLFSYLAIFISVGFMFGSKFLASSKVGQRVWPIIYCSIIVSAIFTNFQISSAKTWWGWSIFQVEMAQIIDQAESPLIVNQERIGNIMPLVYQLNENAKSLKINSNNIFIPKDINRYDVFLLNPTDKIKSVYSKATNSKLELVYEYQEGFINTKLYKLD